MKEFFHGWRRKTGAVTLLMALAVCGIWMRSRVIYDSAWLSIGGRSLIVTSVGGQAFIWFKPSNAGNGWLSIPLTNEQAIESATVRRETATIYFPQWSLAIVLTLLSAGFIFWKPRKRG